MTPRTMIVPLDGSEFAERAVPVARSVAARLRARVIVMSTRWEGHTDGVESYLDRFTGEELGVPVERVLVDEHPASHAIASVVGAHPDSVVCMTSHGRSGARWAILGSVTEDVVRETHTAVLLVGRHCALDWPARLEHLVVCVDGSDAAEPDVPALTDWARALGLDVRVVLVTHPLDVEGATHPNSVLDAVTARFTALGVAAQAVRLRKRVRRGCHRRLCGNVARVAGRRRNQQPYGRRALRLG